MLLEVPLIPIKSIDSNDSMSYNVIEGGLKGANARFLHNITRALTIHYYYSIVGSDDLKSNDL